MCKIVADPWREIAPATWTRLYSGAVTDARPLVLVVDDYPEAREMYAEWLRVCGYRVAVAGTVGQALELARETMPAAILMDLSLPGVDGFEATRLLKADVRTRHIPVLALSGHIGADTASRGARRRVRSVPRQADAAAGHRHRTEAAGRPGRSAPGDRVGPDVSGERRSPSAPPEAGRGVRVVGVERRRGTTTRSDRDAVAVEEPMEVRVNGSPFAVIMRTPGEDLRPRRRVPAGRRRGPRRRRDRRHRALPRRRARGARQRAQRDGRRRGGGSTGGPARRAPAGDHHSGLRSVRTPHHRVAADPGGHGRRPLDGAGRPSSASCRWRCAPHSGPSTPPAASTPPRSPTSRGGCCAPPRTSAATTPSTRSSGTRCSKAGCRSTGRCWW